MRFRRSGGPPALAKAKVDAKLILFCRFCVHCGAAAFTLWCNAVDSALGRSKIG